MTPRPTQPEPFIRGTAYPAVGDVPYPRANPTDTARLPADIWTAATIPVGIRLELVGDAHALDIAYRTATGNLGYRGDGAGITFSVWRGGRKVCEEEAVLGDGLIRLSLGTAAPDKPAIVYLPEGMHPVIQSLTAVKGEIAPAPRQPRWIAYGDWTTQGWTASGPSHAWTAIAGRKVGLDVINFGYAGAARGEVVSAEHIASLEADAITVAYGATCWTRVPYSVGLVEEGFRAFLDVIRQGHPTTPVVVVSPIVRPDAEDEPNRLGATMSDIRHTIEKVTRERILAGDRTLSLIAGAAIIAEEHLADGIHPGNEGHKRIASAVARALDTALRSTTDDSADEALRANELLVAGQPRMIDRSRPSENADTERERDGGPRTATPSTDAGAVRRAAAPAPGMLTPDEPVAMGAEEDVPSGDSPTDARPVTGGSSSGGGGGEDGQDDETGTSEALVESDDQPVRGEASEDDGDDGSEEADGADRAEGSGSADGVDQLDDLDAGGTASEFDVDDIDDIDDIDEPDWPDEPIDQGDADEAVKPAVDVDGVDDVDDVDDVNDVDDVESREDEIESGRDVATSSSH